jgi:hypothetical protein
MILLTFLIRCTRVGLFLGGDADLGSSGDTTMKKIAILAATALASTIAIASPAAAQSGASTALMTATCDGTLPTKDRHLYAATVLRGAVTIEPFTIRKTISSSPAPTTPTTTTGPTFVAGSEGRRGGSPNIHGEFLFVDHYAGSSLTQEVTTGTDTTYAFGCRVTKTTNGTTNEPGSLQSAVNAFSVGERVVLTGPTNVVTSTPGRSVDRFEDGVICISPTKGSVWRVRNDYTGTCTTAMFNELPGKLVRSNSVGVDAPLVVEPDQDAPEPTNNLNATPLIDTESDEG